MPKYAYDRLSAQDNNFLLWERGNVRMHIASTIVCDAGPLRKKDGGIDVDTFKRATEAYLHLVPRYRQRLHAIPFFDHSVWVDDPHFDIDYHIRHTALPKPGSSEQLKKLPLLVLARELPAVPPASSAARRLWLGALLLVFLMGGASTAIAARVPVQCSALAGFALLLVLSRTALPLRDPYAERA
jgi:hypothetical protein